jgi:hypothetical protein
MTFIVNNREYQKPRRSKSWIAVALGALLVTGLMAVRVWF